MSIEVVPCPGHRGCVDVVDSRNSADIDPLHVSMSEWTEFVAAIKAGHYDDVSSSQTSGPDTSPGRV